LNFSSKIISTLPLTDSWVLWLFSIHHRRQSNGFSVKKPMSDRILVLKRTNHQLSLFVKTSTHSLILFLISCVLYLILSSFIS
jgi:hypothetical protein